MKYITFITLMGFGMFGFFGPLLFNIQKQELKVVFAMISTIAFSGGAIGATAIEYKKLCCYTDPQTEWFLFSIALLLALAAFAITLVSIGNLLRDEAQ